MRHVWRSEIFQRDSFNPNRRFASIRSHTEANASFAVFCDQSIALGCDLILILTASVLSGTAYHLAFLDQVGNPATFLSVGGLTYINFAAILAARGAYRPQSLVNFPKQARETTIVWLIVFFVLSAVAFSLKITDTYSRGATLAFFATGWCAIIVWRLAFARFISRALSAGSFAEQKVILLADRAQLAGSSIITDLKRRGYVPVKTFEFRSAAESMAGGSSWLAKSMKEIVEWSLREPIECVFVLASWTNRDCIEQIAKSMAVLPVPVYLLPDNNVAHFLGNRIVTVGAGWTAELQRAPLTRTERAFKRTLDVLIASVVLIMLAPLMLLVAALIKIESTGPVLFMQTRNGFNGRPFKIWKFRTMFVLEDGPVIRQVKKDDPRVTRIGRLLRRTNIDELPQLMNVLAGAMSVVGPRPHALVHNSEYEKIIANYADRHHVKPGLTGWAQINGLRGETQTVDHMARRVEFDLWYINNWSFWLDIQILLRTLMLGLQRNAY